MDLSKMKFVYFRMASQTGMVEIYREPVLYMDLTYLIKGDVLYYYNDREIFLHSGDIILFPQGSLRCRPKVYTDVSYASINVHFTDNFVPPFEGVIHDAITPESLQILRHIDRTWNSPSENAELQCLSLFSYLYYHLIDTVQAQGNPYIRKIKEYILRHIREKITLAEIAEYVHLSPEYCCALFKKETGQTIFNYINLFKVDTAKRLILLGQPLPEVVAEVGMNDYNYFARVFKSHTGMTPLLYQKNLSPK